MQATATVAALAKPLSASTGVSTRVMISTASESMASRSVGNRSMISSRAITDSRHSTTMSSGMSHRPGACQVFHT